MRPAKTQFSQNVELEITYEQQLNYHPPKGLNIFFYDRKKTEKPVNRVNATIFGTSINNELNACKYLHDINAELARMGNYVKKDHLRKSDEPDLIKNPKVRTESILDTSIFKGERDSIISRASRRNNSHKIRVGNRKLDFGKITQDE